MKYSDIIERANDMRAHNEDLISSRADARAFLLERAANAEPLHSRGNDARGVYTRYKRNASAKAIYLRERRDARFTHRGIATCRSLGLWELDAALALHKDLTAPTLEAREIEIAENYPLRMPSRRLSVDISLSEDDGVGAAYRNWRLRLIMHRSALSHPAVFDDHRKMIPLYWQEVSPGVWFVRYVTNQGSNVAVRVVSQAMADGELHGFWSRPEDAAANADNIRAACRTAAVTRAIKKRNARL